VDGVVDLRQFPSMFPTERYAVLRVQPDGTLCDSCGERVATVRRAYAFVCDDCQHGFEAHEERTGYAAQHGMESFALLARARQQRHDEWVAAHDTTRGHG
jgi:hypothetical protein